MSDDWAMTSAELGRLRAAQAGDQAAFAGLTEPYRRALTVHCYRMLGSPQDAEDVVQETLLRAWRRLDGYEPRAPFASWLYRIATNACLDELKRRPRRPQLVAPYPELALAAEEAPIYDPAARYALREGLELGLLTAIQQLPGRQRATLILRDVLGWSAVEVAELLESSVAAVNSALQRARAKVEENLSDAPPPATEMAEERELLDRYLRAFEHDDIEGLVGLLHEDAVLRMPPGEFVRGAWPIARFFRDRAGGGDLANIQLLPTRANGRPAVAIHRRSPGGELVAHGVSLLEIREGVIVGIDTFLDPTLPAVFGFAGGVPAA